LNILLFGDVVGRSGREAIKAHLPGLKRDLAASSTLRTRRTALA